MGFRRFPSWRWPILGDFEVPSEGITETSRRSCRKYHFDPVKAMVFPCLKTLSMAMFVPTPIYSHISYMSCAFQMTAAFDHFLGLHWPCITTSSSAGRQRIWFCLLKTSTVSTSSSPPNGSKWDKPKHHIGRNVSRYILANLHYWYDVRSIPRKTWIIQYKFTDLKSAAHLSFRNGPCRWGRNTNHPDKLADHWSSPKR